MSKKIVAVALSGGVDSAMAACMLKEAGHDILGLTMSLWSEAQRNSPSADNVEDAESFCRTLGIPFHLIDLEQEFKKHVIDYFCREYTHGLTPNPCIACNRYIKFGSLLDQARSLGADYLATGHYARVKNYNGSYHLLQGADITKDQSYMLYTLGQDKLSRVLFPLGNFTKSQVRELASKKGLTAATKPSSQDICFIASDYGSFLNRYVKATPGEIVDDSGRVLGRHKGTAFYTVGQRHGLGLASDEPLYVTGIDSTKSRLIVGTRQKLYHSSLTAVDLSWISGEAPKESIEVSVKIRYRSPDVAATLNPQGSSVEIIFREPQPAVTPGQAVVFYKDDEVIGGGTIES
jgi:tRNA-specific 2-thiouridylase